MPQIESDWICLPAGLPARRYAACRPSPHPTVPAACYYACARHHHFRSIVCSCSRVNVLRSVWFAGSVTLLRLRYTVCRCCRGVRCTGIRCCCCTGLADNNPLTFAAFWYHCRFLRLCPACADQRLCRAGVALRAERTWR
ncbi:hypothetical protein NPIL_579401 [Nephila pilipes]|uniref:Uncharacterized protein n=1 Tax=Nephila pilipes TaxID=299642 RepID=A0A8X6QUA9_NEPPI|nr:hypothetical protein NPIL_579401 [Nephila pilipes]